MDDITRRAALGSLGVGVIFSAKSVMGDQRTDVDAAGKSIKAEFEASVHHVRSQDNHVYLWISEKVKGWVDLNPNTGNVNANHNRLATFSIAAASAGSGKKVKVQFWGYDPNWGSGAGHFDRVTMRF